MRRVSSLSYLLRLVKAHNLLTFTMNAQFVVEELCSTVATFTMNAKYMLTLYNSYM